MAASSNKADLSLLFGVQGEGSIDKGSGKLIKSNLNSIVKELNKNPFKIKVELESEPAHAKTWARGFQSQLNTISKESGFHVSISKLDIGKGALTAFKKQLTEVVNTISLEKGVSITLQAKNIGDIKSKNEDLKNSAEEAAKKTAHLNHELEKLASRKKELSKSTEKLDSIRNLGLGFSDNPEEYAKEINEIIRQYDKLSEGIGTQKELKKEASIEAVNGLIAETDALEERIKVVNANIEADKRAKAEAAENAKIDKLNLSKEIASLKNATKDETLKADIKVLTNFDKNEWGKDQGFADIIKEANTLSGRYNTLIEKINKVDVESDQTSQSVIDGLRAEGESLKANIHLVRERADAWNKANTERITLEKAEQNVGLNELKNSGADISKRIKDLYGVQSGDTANNFKTELSSLEDLAQKTKEWRLELEKAEKNKLKPEPDVIDSLKQQAAAIRDVIDATQKSVAAKKAQLEDLSKSVKNLSGNKETKSEVESLNVVKNINSGEDKTFDAMAKKARGLVNEYEKWQKAVEDLKGKEKDTSEFVLKNLERQGEGLKENIHLIAEQSKAWRENYENQVRYEQAQRSLSKEDLTSRKRQIDGGIKGLEKVRQGSDSENYVEELANLDKIIDRVNQWKLSLKEFQSLSPEKQTADRIKGLREEAAAIQDVIDATQKSVAAKKGELDKAEKEKVTLKEVTALYHQIDNFLTKNPKSRGTKEVEELEKFKNELFAVIDAVKKVSNGVEDVDKSIAGIKRERLEKISSDFSRMEIDLRKANKTGKNFSSTLANVMDRFGGWTLVSSTLMGAVYQFKQMVSIVKELDSAMTELYKVTDESADTYNDFFDNASKRAKELGVTISDSIRATADYARLGYTLKESASLAESALVYKNVGDGIANINDATESIISTMKAFNVEASQSMLIVDKFNEVGNNFPISSKGIGEALVRSASALASANNTLDESIALVTAANTVVQNPIKVGTTLKTVSMYLRAAKSEAEKAGESTEGMAQSVSKLRNELMGLTNGKIDIQLDANTYKSTYQILKEISEVWHELSDITRANILERLGGKRNANVVASIINNFEVAERVLYSTANAAGSALEENEKHLESIEGKISRFRAQFESLSHATVDSGWVKTLIDGGTSLLSILTKIIDKLGSLPPLIGAITAGAMFYKKGKGLNTGADNLSKKIEDYTELKDVILRYNAARKGSLKDQEDFDRSIEDSDKLLQDYLGSLNDSEASYKGYKKYCKEAKEETKSMGDAMVGINHTIKGLAFAFGEVAAAMAISWVIDKVVRSIHDFIKAGDIAIEKTQELNKKFKDLQKHNRDDVDKLASLKSEYESLSSGVSEYGENIALTAEEYSRYKEIVSDIVEISPKVAEGYDKENGYLVQKNGLIERSIDLLNQQYEAELRRMTTTEGLTEFLDGHFASHGKVAEDDRLHLGNSSGTTSKSTSDLIVALNSVKPYGWRAETPLKLAEETLKNMNYSDSRIQSELEKYVDKATGAFSSDEFWRDYGGVISRNVETIISNIDYDKVIYKSEEQFDKSIDVLRTAASQYLDIEERFANVNKDISNQLLYIAEANKDFAGLSNEAKGMINSFVNNINIEDLSKPAGFLKSLQGYTLEVDEDKVREVQASINKLVRSIAESPEIQTSMGAVFDIKSMFDANNLNVDAYLSSVRMLIDGIDQELRNRGFTADEAGNILKPIELSLDIEKIQTQLDTVREAIAKSTAVEYQHITPESSDQDYLDLIERKIKKLSAEDLKIAYKIVSEEGSMSFDDLTHKIETAKIQASELIDVFDFSNMSAGMSDAKAGLDGIISAMDQLRAGTALTREQLANLALQYPELLQQSDLFVNGSIEGQKALLDTILSSHQAAYDAQIDAKIAELKATEEVINSQLEMEYDKADIINEISTMSANGQIDNREQLCDKIAQLDQLQGENYVGMENGILSVHEEALNKQLASEGEFGDKSADNIWKPYSETIRDSHSEGFRASLRALNNFGSKFTTGFKNIGSGVVNVAKVIGSVINDALHGELKDASYYWGEITSGFQGADETIDAGGVDVQFKGGDVTVGDQELGAWIDNQKKASVERINSLNEMKRRTINAYKNLQELKKLDLSGIYGSAGSIGGKPGSGGGGHKPHDPDKPDDHEKDPDKNPSPTEKDVEEYIANIDAYYEAVKKLEKIQREKESLMKKIEHTEDPTEKIKLAKELIKIHHKEAEAEKELVSTKKIAIAGNVAQLRSLGFEVEYNAETNDLLIKNLEHVNEISAKTAGEYGSVEEATNAVRKETENLIEATEQLNKDNIDSAKHLEDLGYAVEETKAQIIDYVEEIYSKQGEALQKIIDLRKELINSTKEELEYEDTIANKVKEVADLQAKIDQLSLDDSREAQVKRNELMQQLADKQKDLADTQQEHSTNKQNEALDKIVTDFNEEKEKDLESMRLNIKTSEELWGAFYQTILGQNVDIGDSINKEIVGSWIRAGEAVRDYSSTLNALKNPGSVSEAPSKYHTGGFVERANLRADEVLAVLQRGELVLDEKKQKTLYRIIDFNQVLSEKLGMIASGLSSPQSSLARPSVTPDVFKSSVNNSSMVFEPHINVTVEGSSDGDPKKYGTAIADSVIDRLGDAFERRGISNNKSFRLKP